LIYFFFEELPLHISDLAHPAAELAPKFFQAFLGDSVLPNTSVSTFEAWSIALDINVNVPRTLYVRDEVVRQNEKVDTLLLKPQEQDRVAVSCGKQLRQ
jgi:hypothetical protein